MSVLNKTLLLSAVLLSSSGLPLQADQIVMPSKQNYQLENAPQRGSLQVEVLSLYGEPESKRPAVGTPAISSWVYPEFKVFFENGRVIHTVGI